MEEACQGNLPVNPLNLPTKKSFMLIWCNLAEVVLWKSRVNSLRFLLLLRLKKRFLVEYHML